MGGAVSIDAMGGAVMLNVALVKSGLRAVKDWVLFCPRTPLIKTAMRLFTAASNNYSQLWLCSFDYDSHE